ncbi:MAG: diguanylate cyclase domain-containing protein [Solirubrobacteraceae bacterium]
MHATAHPPSSTHPADDSAPSPTGLPRRCPMPVSAVSLALLIVALLLVRGEGVSSELQPLVLLPILWAALRCRRGEAAAIVLGVAGGLAGISIADRVPVAQAVSAVTIYELVGALLVLGVGTLRSHMTAAVAEREEALRQATVLGDVARALNSTLDPDEVVSVAVRLAAEIASPPGLRARRANYCRIIDGLVRVEAECDTEGEWVGASWPLSEHPHLARAVQTRRATVGALDQLGPAVREINRRQQVAHGGWIPVTVDGELHGVLAIAGRNRPVTEQDLSRCAAIVEMMHLALTNALAHQRYQTAALTDPLTALPNRRGLTQHIAERPNNQRFAVLAIDVDGLKETNDRHGHSAGDELLRLIGSAIHSTLRADDVVARVGGDEFICVLFGADETAGAEAAARILDAVVSTSHDYLHPSVSIGVAVAEPGTALDTSVGAADAALYRAKHTGGSRHILATASPSARSPAAAS